MDRPSDSCHARTMAGVAQYIRFNRRIIDALYTDAMILADEARHYFDDYGRRERDGLSPNDRIAFSCESIKVTTRLMHVIAWLLTQRAVDAGEMSVEAARDPSRRLGPAPDSASASLAVMPLSARGLIRASIDIHRRVATLDDDTPPTEGPARLLMSQLAGAF